MISLLISLVIIVVKLILDQLPLLDAQAKMVILLVIVLVLILGISRPYYYHGQVFSF